jgi:aspartate carbamoyltransferase catalytic subunit
MNEKVSGSYHQSSDGLSQSKRVMIVMHPPPRVDEIVHDLDNALHAKRFKQVWYGLLARMSLIGSLDRRMKNCYLR